MNRMKQLREEQGLTMKEAAKRLGVPYTTYVNYEKGTREPNSEMLIALAGFFGCSIGYLIGNGVDRAGNKVTDGANDFSPFLLELTGNLEDAQKLQELISQDQVAEAHKHLLALSNFELSDIDPQINRILTHAKRLNANGLSKLGDYAEDLSENPKYQKKKPSKEG